MQCFSRCFIFQKVHSKSEPNKQVKTQNLLGFSIFSLIYKLVMIFFAMPVFLSTCYKKNIVVTTNRKSKGFNTAISISAKSRIPTAVHVERLLYAVGREKGPYCNLCPRTTTTSAVTVTSNCQVLCLFYRTLLKR